MINEKMRQDFEEWLDSSSEFQAGGEHAAYYWIAWQASRAALCVELPEAIGEDNCGGDFAYQRANDDAIEACRSAIESTGVRTR